MCDRAKKFPGSRRPMRESVGGQRLGVPAITSALASSFHATTDLGSMRAAARIRRPLLKLALIMPRDHRTGASRNRRASPAPPVAGGLALYPTVCSRRVWRAPSAVRRFYLFHQRRARNRFARLPEAACSKLSRSSASGLSGNKRYRNALGGASRRNLRQRDEPGAERSSTNACCTRSGIVARFCGSSASSRIRPSERRAPPLFDTRPRLQETIGIV